MGGGTTQLGEKQQLSKHWNDAACTIALNRDISLFQGDPDLMWAVKDQCLSHVSIVKAIYI